MSAVGHTREPNGNERLAPRGSVSFWLEWNNNIKSLTTFSSLARPGFNPLRQLQLDQCPPSSVILSFNITTPMTIHFPSSLDFPMSRS
jgi:hypothetical protein